MPKESKLGAMTMEKDEAFAVNFCREMFNRVKGESGMMQVARICTIMEMVSTKARWMTKVITKEVSR